MDAVTSYFGMRKIALGKDDKGVTRLMLNGKPVFQVGPLDQGFWPDGIYTAPTDEALRLDIAETKRLGFNTTRKHVKVEPDRWYYWCDKLGPVSLAGHALRQFLHRQAAADRQAAVQNRTGEHGEEPLEPSFHHHVGGFQ